MPSLALKQCSTGKVEYVVSFEMSSIHNFPAYMIRHQFDFNRLGFSSCVNVVLDDFKCENSLGMICIKYK